MSCDFKPGDADFMWRFALWLLTADGLEGPVRTPARKGVKA